MRAATKSVVSEELRARFARAKNVVVLTGAGVSAESGVPTFRGGVMRPDVVLFGEMLPRGVFEQAAMWAESCDLCFVVGTSAVVYPAAAIPEIARAAGAYVIEVNPERTPLSNICDETLMGKAGEILPLIE